MTGKESGKRKMNFANYTNAGINIVRNSTLHEDPNFVPSLDKIVDYQHQYSKDVAKEMIRQK